MRNIFCVSILIFFLILVNAAFAVSFTASSDPTGINAGQSNQLVNFSIQNTGSVNITQLNITLPPGFTFTESSGTTTTSPYTASSSTPSWTNSTSIGIVGNGATQYFWIYVNTPSRTGSSGFNISTSDANNAFTSDNVTFTLFDTLKPTYSSNTTSPTSNTTYTINQSYWFNITWTDGVDISKVLLEHNITGSSTPHNETMSNSSSVYYFNTTNLAAGTYVWRVYANDTNNTFNTTLQFTYLVAQATNNISVLLNGTLNGNITSVLNTVVNITANASCLQINCNISISKDGSIIASVKPNPYITTDTITSIGLHNYTISISGNTNYTSNSTTYYVATVPSYTAITSNLPLTFSNTTTGVINVTFDSNPSLVSVKIQGDWSGTATNYTMSNTSGLSYYYNITFPAGTFNWKIWGTYSNHTFNLTSLNSFTINQGSPALVLSISPSWTLDTPVQTNASCTSSTSGITVSLYKNGTSVSNPDVKTFGAGNIYTYLCNNTANQNYTTVTATNTLTIRPTPSASLSFVQASALVEAVQNSTITTEIKIKNTGTNAQNISIELSDIDKNWYSVTPATANVFVGVTTTFTISFNIGNADVKDYKGKLTAKSANATISQDFTLRVLPSEETKSKINDTLTLYKLDISKLETRLNEIKANVSNIESIGQKIVELKAALKQAEDYINANNYFQAQQTFETIKSLSNEVDSLLKLAESGGNKIEIPSKVWFIIIGVVGAIIVGVLVYLFWPTKKGYKPETGQYIFSEKKSGIFKTIKSLFKFKRKEKTGAIIPV